MIELHEVILNWLETQSDKNLWHIKFDFSGYQWLYMNIGEDWELGWVAKIYTNMIIFDIDEINVKLYPEDPNFFVKLRKTMTKCVRMYG